MKNIKSYIQEFKNRFALSGIVTFAIGLLLIIYPAFTGKALCYTLGGVLLVKGAGGLISQYRAAGGNFVPVTMMGNLSTCLMGLFVALRYDLIISLIPFICGMFLLFSGVSSLQRAFSLKNLNYPGWNHGLIFTIIKVVLAAIIIINPFGTAMTLTRFIGICLVYDGVSGLITVLETAKAKHDYNKAQNEVRDMNLNKNSYKTTPDENIPVVEAEFVEVVREVKDSEL